MTWDGLTPPYGTIVADPPWAYDEGWPPGEFSRDKTRRKPLGYTSMSVDQIAALPVSDIGAEDAHLYLWTTNRYLRAAYDVVESWGFAFSQVLVWCKPPMGIGPGGAFAQTAEFVLFARRGRVRPAERVPSSWWLWNRSGHSVKPAGFLDVVESVSPGPRVELFARQPRFGWDSWGHGFEELAG